MASIALIILFMFLVLVSLFGFGDGDYDDGLHVPFLCEQFSLKSYVHI